jgi:hypothetical protein
MDAFKSQVDLEIKKFSGLLKNEVCLSLHAHEKITVKKRVRKRVHFVNNRCISKHFSKNWLNF